MYAKARAWINEAILQVLPPMAEYEMVLYPDIVDDRPGMLRADTWIKLFGEDIESLVSVQLSEEDMQTTAYYRLVGYNIQTSLLLMRKRLTC